MLNLNDLKVGDTVRFTNGQTAKVVKVKDWVEHINLRFDKEVACDIDDVLASHSWNYYCSGECVGCTNHIVKITKKGETKMKIDLDTLKIGNSVRFSNGQVAKVVDIHDNYGDFVVFFDKKVQSDIGDNSTSGTNWYYEEDGTCTGCTNHIVEIIKKGETKMNKKKIEKSLEWHKKKIAELEEALKEPERKRWFPKQDEQYYGVGTSTVTEYHNFNEECTNSMYEMNNIFKTKEEAEKELARRKAETELLDMCDWTPDCDRMWIIYYDKSTSKFDIDYFCSHQYSQYLFASEESAQKAIDTLGKEKLKLIFRIDS